MRNLLRKRCLLWLAAVLMTGLMPTSSFAEEKTHVVILATSDLHGNIMSWSYEDDAETTNNGMARLYTYIQHVREENPIVFLIDGGDAIQGTIMTDDIANKNPDEPHPVIAAMNFMGYDSMTLGNHEFNWGVPSMMKILNTAEFPVLGANILNEDGDAVTGRGWTIIERGGVRLAVIGVCTPDIPIWDSGKDGIENLTYEDASEAVTRALKEIGSQADIIMVSAHMGLFSEFDEEGGSDSAQKILNENPSVELLQVAHMHITVDEKQGDTLIGGVRNSGREIARFDITLDEDKKIVDSSLTIVDMEGIEPSEKLRSIPALKEIHEKTISLVENGTSEEGGQESGEYSPLGSTTAKFQPENEIRGLPEGRLMDTAVIDLILKVQLLDSGADVTSCALFKDTSDLPAGDINYGNIFDIYKYDNTLYRLDVTGKELKDYMEWSAECYNQWVPGDINISFDPEYPGYLYDMFKGVDYEINLSKPKGERIENVMFHGEPLKDDQVLKLAVNNYRYSSALMALGLVERKPDWESSNSIRDMIVNYLSQNSPVKPTIDNNWCITGVDLSKDDPRRAEIISYINEGLLPTPYNASYNLSDYDALVAEAKANLAEGETEAPLESH